ncbi:MAG: NUDIX domain-containing protein [Thermoflexales bacterium]|nr:NUDIX domain-containing protein [Thermoflexales bacterium]
MPDLFASLPALEGAHPLLTGRRVALIGVSVLLRDDDAWYFEVQRPRYWARRPDGVLSVGIGGIGGGLLAGEDALTALRREVREELGVDLALEAPPHTVLLHQWRVAGYLEVPAGPPEAWPYIVNLLPPQLGGPETPDALAIVTFLGRPLDRPRRGDLFGLLTVTPTALPEFLDVSEWPLEAVQAHPGLGLDLASELPAGCVLRPVLTARAFRVVMGQRPKPGGG